MRGGPGVKPRTPMLLIPVKAIVNISNPQPQMGAAEHVPHEKPGFDERSLMRRLTLIHRAVETAFL